jgi:hypothetical protein
MKMKEKINITYKKVKGSDHGTFTYDINMSTDHLERVILDLRAELQERRKPHKARRPKTVNPNPDYRPPMGPRNTNPPKVISAVCLAVVGSEEAVEGPFYMNR